MYEELKKRRLELNKTIEEIAEKTKIKKQYLELIEEGKFDELPIEVYTKAYIKTYAEILGIDPSPIIKDYEEYLKNKKQSLQLIELTTKLEHKKDFSKYLHKKLPSWSITAVIILCVILLVVFLIHSEKNKYEIPQTVTQKVLENANIQEKVEQRETFTNQQNLKIEAIDKVWMRIIIDDKEKKEFLLNPGQKIELQADKFFRIHIGNAGGVKIIFNEKDLGKLGEIGQVVYLKLPEDKN
ncbi:MAG: RodZ domain-containing protein [Thermodesulfovibrio sp.]